MADKILPREFYDRDPVLVAKELLGCVLVARCNEGPGNEGFASGLIVEVEAYLARGDAASHSFRGPTMRNRSMFAAPGTLYVYSIHAKYCLNAVTQAEGVGSAVLIRAIQPLEGLDAMRRRRGRDALGELTRGPARLCQALAVDRSLDGHDLTRGESIWIESGTFAEQTPDQNEARPRAAKVLRSPRVGISTATNRLLRFFLDSPYVSGSRQAVQRAAGRRSQRPAK